MGRGRAIETALGANNLKYTPKWAVGCFFVPFLNLVMPYQVVREIWKASNGGSEPVWARNGKELFYRGEHHLMAVSVLAGETFAVTSPKQLFPHQDALRIGKHTSYDVARDGKRFLFVQSKVQNQGLNVVFNWFEEVRRLAPAGNYDNRAKPYSNTKSV